MGEISLEMIWKRLEEMQADIRAVRDEQARTNENVMAIARTLVTVQRDLRIVQRDLAKLSDRVTVLTVAVDDHPPAHL
jgi:septal ring factor EnvC (AmiA/AmiB activator)